MALRGKVDRRSSSAPEGSEFWEVTLRLGRGGGMMDVLEMSLVGRVELEVELVRLLARGTRE